MDNNSSAKGRQPDGRFAPGVSGNPSGRPPKDVALSDLLRGALDNQVGEYLDTEDRRLVIQAIVDTLISEALLGKDWLGAIKAIFDRLEGRPRQAVDFLSGFDLPTIQGVQILPRKDDLADGEELPKKVR